MEMTSVGTLLVFMLVSAGVGGAPGGRIRLELSVQDAAGAAGANPVNPLLGTLIIGSSPMTQLRLVVWLVIGLVIDFSYGRRHSALKTRQSAKKLAG